MNQHNLLRVGFSYFTYETSESGDRLFRPLDILIDFPTLAKILHWRANSYHWFAYKFLRKIKIFLFDNMYIAPQIITWLFQGKLFDYLIIFAMIVPTEW